MWQRMRTAISHSMVKTSSITPSSTAVAKRPHRNLAFYRDNAGTRQGILRITVDDGMPVLEKAAQENTPRHERDG